MASCTMLLLWKEPCMGLLLFYLLLALGVSFMCSLTEAGILSIPRSRVAMLVKQGKRAGRMLDAMKRNIDRPLAAILTLNTVAHTVGAAGIGAQALLLWGSESVAITSAVLTILVLVLSEIIPKTLGTLYAARFATLTTYVVHTMIIVTYPLVIIFQAISRLLAARATEQTLTREEMALMAELGQEDGAIVESEYRIINNLLHLNTMRVNKIMTPRSVAFMLNKDMTCQQVIDEGGLLRFSRIPIYGRDIDDVIGFVLRHEIYESVRDQQGDRKLEDIVKPVQAVPDTMSVRKVLHEFVQQGQHLFLVLDEHGGVDGLVTFEDAIETLLGVEIVDETDEVPDMRELASQLFRARFRGRRL